MKKLLMLITFILILSNLKAESILYERDSYCYAQKGETILYMDVYKRVDAKPSSPCMLFLFGGGFTVGNRRDRRYLEYFEHLLSEGIVVVAIDYRLGMVGVENEPWLYPDALEYSIKIGVEDLFDAVKYLQNNAELLSIDKDKIMVSGSSAGAIIALESDYIIRNKCGDYDNSPQEDFKFAGVISFSGGLYFFCKNWESCNRCAPTLLFHGGKDWVVTPYSIVMFEESFFGSTALIELFEKSNSDYYYCFYPELGHEVSYQSMNQEHDLISEFLHQYILDN
jgi:dipeptidyl aminopeptidase/acylaminoacyl peptidase